MTHVQTYGEGDEKLVINIEREFNGDKMTTKMSFEHKDGAENTLEADFMKASKDKARISSV